MRVFVDENIPRMTVRALRELGHAALDVRGTSEQGMLDDVVWDKAQAEKRLLIARRRCSVGLGECPSHLEIDHSLCTGDILGDLRLLPEFGDGEP